MPPGGRATSASAVARGGGHGDGGGASQCHPSQHSDTQYGGLFRGLGVSSKEPVCGKKNSTTKMIQNSTHFAVGCKKWEDEQCRGISMSHVTFADPEVVYGTCAAPDKNSSTVELRQRNFVAEVHFRTEQRERYEHPGMAAHDARGALVKHQPQIHLGDDVPELITQTQVAHGRLTPESSERASSLRAAGAGTLVRTSVWAKDNRCNPVTGGPRNLDLHDLQSAAGLNFSKMTHNNSTIVMEANVRNPILGHHVPLEVLAALAVPGKMYASEHHVAAANASVPPLRSLGALRPHH